MSQYLPIISLVVSIVALALSILIPFVHSRNNDHWDEKEIRDMVVTAVRESERVERIVTDKVNSKLSRIEIPKNNLHMDELVDEIMERLKPEIQKMKEQMPLPKKEGSATGNVRSGWKKFGYFRERTGGFELTDSPTGSTVYCFVSDPKSEEKAWFDVFDVQRVVEERNLLQDDCCSIDGEGNNLLTLEKGLAVCKDGKWTLDKKLKIKFS